MDLLYSLLKVASLIATGLFGALGLLTKYRDDAGKITKWGKIALIGILLSSGLSLILYALEASKAETAAIKAKAEADATAQKLEIILLNAQTTAEQQKKSLMETEVLKEGLTETLKQQQLNLQRSDYIAKGMESSIASQRVVLSGNEKILSGVDSTIKKQGEVLKQSTATLYDVNRSLNPLENVGASFWLKVRLKGPELSAYASRLENRIKELLPILESDKYARTSEAYASVLRDDGKVQTVTINQDSPLFPSKINERFAYTVLNHTSVTLRFYKKPISIKEFPFFGELRLGETKYDPDIEMSFEEDPKNPFDIGIQYDVNTKEIRIRGSGHRTDPKYWNSTGKILSMLDLVGAQVFIDAGHTLVSFEEREKRIHPEIDNLILDIGSRKGLWFRRDKLKAHVDKSNKVIYEYTFPDTFEKLIEDLK